jgi:hypothetical protein
MALVNTAVPSKDQVADTLAQAHYTVELGIQQIIRLLSAEEQDDSEPIKLLVVNANTVPGGIQPLFFGPQNANGILYPSMIIEITPEEYQQLQAGALRLPNNLRLGQEIRRAQ